MALAKVMRGFVVGASAAIAVSIPAAVILDPDERWRLSVLTLAVGTLAVAAIPLIARFKTQRVDILEPVIGGTVLLAVLFGIRPLAMVFEGEFDYRGVDIIRLFPQAVALGFIGTAVFVAGYEWIHSRPPTRLEVRPRPAGTDIRIVYVYAGILAALSIVLFALHLSRLGTDLGHGLRLLFTGSSPELVARWANTTEYLSSAPILAADAAIIVGVAQNWRLRRSTKLLVALLLAFPLLVFFVSGARRYMLPCALVPLATYMLITGWRPSPRFLAFGLPLLFLVLATIPFVRWVGARDEGVGPGSAVVEAFANPARAVHRFILGPDTNMAPALAVEVGVLRAPEDFSYGRATVGDLLLAPIPQIIYPDKPETARDEMLTRAFGAPCDVSVGGVCDDFSIIGTFYQDFWVPGVILLMAAMGAASAAFWRRLREGPADPRWVVAAGTWIVFLPIIFRAGFMPAFQWWLYFLLPCLLGAWLLVRARDVDPS